MGYYKQSSDLFNRTSSSRLWDNKVIQPNLLEVDLRQEFDDLLLGSVDMPQRGYWVAYRRFDYSAPASGYDDVYRVGNEVAPGYTRPPIYPYKDELLMTRSDPMFQPMLADNFMQAGLLKSGQYIFYARYDFIPQANDQLFDINWDDMTKRPPDTILNGKYLKKYTIREVYPFRGDQGRIEYWIMYVVYDLIAA